MCHTQCKAKTRELVEDLGASTQLTGCGKGGYHWSLLLAAVLEFDARGRLGFLALQASRVEELALRSGLGLLTEHKGMSLLTTGRSQCSSL
jgi:hypothetical protein